MRRELSRATAGFVVIAFVLATGTSANADRLRNIPEGRALPPFSCAGLDKAPVKSEDAAGKVTVLVYLSAQQRQSERALEIAHRVVGTLPSGDIQLFFMSADMDQTDYFRQLRDHLKAHEPFALDEGCAYYGQIGLIVFPTTVVASKDGKLLHVLAGWTRDYEHKLDSYCRHALGELDDAALDRRLHAKQQDADPARATAERHRSVAKVLRSKGLTTGAIKELRQAIASSGSYTIGRASA